MDSRFPFLYLAMVCWLSPVVAAESGREVIEEWIEAQAALKTLEADFVQERTLVGLRRPVINEGRLWFDRRDGRMRWQVGEPPETVAIYRDDAALIIRYKRGTVERRKLDAEEQAQSDLERTFLQTGVPGSIEQFEELFTINRVAREDGFHRVALAVKDARMAASLERLHFLIDPETQVLAGYDLFFRDGSELSTRFSAVRRNVELDDALFDPDLSGLKEVESGGR